MKTATKAVDRERLHVKSLKWAVMLLLLGLVQQTALARTYVSEDHEITLSCEGQGTAEVWSYYGDYKSNSGSRGIIRRLVATPAKFWKFKEWQLLSGDGEIQGETTNATAYYEFGDQDAQIKAVFYQALDKVEVVSGSGQVEVDANNPKLIQVKPDKGYRIGSVYWSYIDDNGMGSARELIETSTTEGWSIYEAPTAYGNVEVSFTSMERTNNVRVTFNSKGHGTAPENQEMTFSDGVDLRVTKPEDPTPDGKYTFMGWFTDYQCTKLYDFNTVLSKDMLTYSYDTQKYTLTLYAGWTKTGGTIHFMPNFPTWDGMGEMPDVVVNSIETGTYTIPPCSFVHQQGKNCIGWATSASGSIKYHIGDKIIVTDDMRLYAIWKTTSGTCGVVDANAGLTGKEVTWTVTQGPSHAFDVLTIKGTGTMNDDSPWSHFRSTVTSIVIEEGIENIGKNAFSNFTIVTNDIIIPASVKKIGGQAFQSIASYKNNPGISITTASDSQLESIDDKAFKCANASIDLSTAARLKTIPNSKSEIFISVKKDITLPSSITFIEDTKNGKYTSFNNFKGDHVYFPLPGGKLLSVNNQIVGSDEILDGRKVDLIGRLFDNLQKRGKSNGLSLALLDGPESTKAITTEGPFSAYGYGNEAEIISEARPGERVVLSWDSEGVTPGYYISGFTFNTTDVTATQNSDNNDYSFIMPSSDVEVRSVLSPQEEYMLDLTTNTQVVIPQSMYMLLNTLGGYDHLMLDPNTGMYLYYLDLNRDGTPDLELTVPLYDKPDYEEEEEPAYDEDDEDDEDDEEIPGDGGENDYYEDDDTGGDDDDEVDEDPFKYEYTVKLLNGAQLVTTNCRFDLIYPPFPYKYNKVLIKLSDNFETKEMERLEMLDDDYTNSSTIVKWAGNPNTTHNVQLHGRQLYKDGDWNTLCLPFNVTIIGSELDGPGVEARPLSNANITNKVLTMNFADPVTELEAGVPYIIKWNKGVDIYEPLFPGVTIPDLSTYSGNDASAQVAAWLAAKGYDNGAGDERVRFLGTFDEIYFLEKNTSILFLGANNTLYYPQPAPANPNMPLSIDNRMVYPSIGAFRAYIKIGDDSGQARQIADFNINFGDPSGIVSQPVDTNNADAWYTTSGVKLNSAPKTNGMYIHGKQKVIVSH